MPKTAESFLGMYLIDFGFEREVAIESGPKMLKSGIIVGDPDFQPPAKRTKSSIETEQSQQEEKKDASHRSTIIITMIRTLANNLKCIGQLLLKWTQLIPL